MIEITQELLEQAEHHAARGLTMRQIAAALGMGKSTFYDKLKQSSDFSDAIEKGKASGLAHITNALFESALKGNVTAQIFFLKNRAPEEWKDRVPEGSGEDVPKPQKVEVIVRDARIADPD